MKQSLKFFFSTLFAVGVLAQASLAQTQFLIRYQQGQTLQTITDGATITFATEGIGQSASATVTVTYRGLTFATINGFDLSGATDFSVSSNLALPATLNPNDSAAFQIQFNPSSTGKMTGKVAISFTEGRTSGAINVNLVGVLPDFGLSFIPLPGGNQTSIPASLVRASCTFGRAATRAL